MNDVALIRPLEEELLQTPARKSADRLNSLLADDFIEFGSSGRAYGKPEIMAALLAEAPVRISLEDYRAELLAPGVALATYRARKAEPAVTSLRSSIWIFRDGRWQIRFHQGTLTAG